MKKLPSFLLLFAALVFTGCGTPQPSPAPASPTPAPSPAVSAPSRKWIANADHIHTEKFDVYYEGTADGAYANGKKEWHGTIKGKIYFTVSGSVPSGKLMSSTVFVEKGTLTLGPGGAMHVKGGPSRITVAD